MLTGLQRVAWDTPYADRHADPGETCQLVPPHTTLRHGLWDYAYHCLAVADGVIAETFYYPTDDASPRIVLRRADFHLSADDPGLSAQVEQQLGARLAADRGAAAVPGNVFEIGAYRPDPGLSWTAGPLTVFLHHNRVAVTPSGIRTGVQLIAVRREILALRARQLQVDDAITITSSCPSTFRTVAQDTHESLFRRALAYETWWSLSQAVPGDPTAEGADVDPATGDQARRQALALYTEVIRTAPGSPEAQSAILRLPRLKLLLDTGERAFFCFYC